jgi:NAD(P)H-hydrate epimerase
MEITDYAKQIILPKPDSTKGENGRVLVIGGSKLFHAASFWSATMASKIVDMVHFASPMRENNELMRVKAKEKFWEGIVVPWEEVEHYISEDDCILIGPGMERGRDAKNSQRATW